MMLDDIIRTVESEAYRLMADAATDEYGQADAKADYSRGVAELAENLKSEFAKKDKADADAIRALLT